MSIIVTTKSGDIHYTVQNLQAMLEDKKMYMAADNLPKWLMVLGYSSRKAYKVIGEIIQAEKDGATTVIDVSGATAIISISR